MNRSLPDSVRTSNDSILRGDVRLQPAKGGMMQCLDEATGRVLWRLMTPNRGRDRLPPKAHYSQQQCGTCSSPAVVGKRAYILSSACEIICLDVDSLAHGNDGPFRDEGQYMAGPGKPPVPLQPDDAEFGRITTRVQAAIGALTPGQFLSAAVIIFAILTGAPAPSAAGSVQGRLSLGLAASTQKVNSISLDLALDDNHYLPLALTLPEARTARIEVGLPPEWKPEIEVHRQGTASNRCQLVRLSEEPVAIKPNEPQILWLHVSSRGHPAGEHRIPLHVQVDGTSLLPLTLALHIWPVSLDGAERPFHVRGYYELTSMTGGYEAGDPSVHRLDAFFRAYAQMGGDVFDWTVNWPQVFPHVRIAGTDRTLRATANRNAAVLDLAHLPELDFSYFDPWFEVARRHGVTRFEAHVENVTSERWQWALDTAFGKGRVQTGTPEASRVSVWLFRELKRHVERQGFHGFFAKISDEILPEAIPSYLVTAKVAREAGWRPFTTITGIIPRTAEYIRAMNLLCDQWQLSFSGKDAFLRLLRQRYSLSKSTVALETKWYPYSNGGAEATWVATKVFGPKSWTDIPTDEVETLDVLEDGKFLRTSGGSPWGNHRKGLAFTAAHLFGGAVYLSTSDGRDPKEHRIELNIVHRREDPAGEVLVAIDPTDEIWCYGGPESPDRLPYPRTWALPVMTLYHGFQGFGQWAFYWWQDTSRIVWIDPQNRIVISPAYCGFHDGWRDALLFHRLLTQAGRTEYAKVLGPGAQAGLRVGITGDPTYPTEARDVPSVTTITNADDFTAMNAARRQSLKALALAGAAQRPNRQ